MKIKSLLLGSAAAMVAVSGAQAADAIIVEPEPMEYVRVCDMYGSGYFYIPGTETCLKINGYVRVQYSGNVGHEDGTLSDHDAYARAEINFIAKNETDYGTLGSHIRWRMQRSEATKDDAHDKFTSSEGYDSGTSRLQKATINLAGFRMGFDAAGGHAINRYVGYGFYNANADGNYGFHTALFFEYGGKVGDFEYVVGIQDSSVSGAIGQPDPYAAVTFSAGGFDVGAGVIYDSNGGDDGGGGIYYHVRGDYDMSSFLPGAKVGAWYRADDGETDYVKGHQWGVTMKANLGDKLTAFAGYSDYNGQGAKAGTNSRLWTAGVRWKTAPGLYIQPEYGKSLESGAGKAVLRVHRSF